MDYDGKLDGEEIAFDSGLINFKNDNYLPTVMQCINYASANDTLLYVKSGFDRFKRSSGGSIEVLSSIRILPLNSDPTMADSDGDFMLDCYDNNLDKTEYWEDTTDENPLYAYYDTSDFYGQNAMGITVKRTTKNKEQYLNIKNVSLSYDLYDAGNQLDEGMKKNVISSALIYKPFPYEVQEYMQSCCDTVIQAAIDAAIDAKISTERINLMKKYLTPELIMAVGTTESAWCYGRFGYIGGPKTGVETSYTGLIALSSITNCLGGAGASTNAKRYANIYCSISGTAAMLAQNFAFIGQGERGFSNKNYINNNNKFDEIQFLYDILYSYGYGRQNDYFHTESRVTAAYKLFAFNEFLVQNEKPGIADFNKDNLEDYSKDSSGDAVTKYTWNPVNLSDKSTFKLPVPNNPKTIFE